MHSTLDPIDITSPVSHPTPTARPHALVLQPNGCLDRNTSQEFQQVLQSALEQATEAVIVDLLWVDSTDAAGISALVNGMQHASALKKSLSFQSMDMRTRTALETEWNQQWERSVGSWNRLFQHDLEQFLDSLLQPS